MLSADAKAQLLDLIDSRVSERLREMQSTAHPVLGPWLTVEEAAAYLRTTRGAVYKRIKRKQLPAHRPEGSKILLRREDLDLQAVRS